MGTQCIVFFLYLITLGQNCGIEIGDRDLQFIKTSLLYFLII